MNRLPLIILLLLGLIAATGLGWWLGARSSEAPASATKQAQAKPEEKKVLYWYDPMMPGQRFDQPGKSPFMDMQLVPKYADSGESADGVVSIDPRLVQNLGVRTAQVRRAAMQGSIRATGSVSFDDNEVSVVQARVSGIVERLNVRTALSEVREGQSLMTLIAPEWTAAQAEYLALRGARGGALDGLRAAARKRLSLLGMSTAQIAAIDASGQAQQRIVVSAPRAGVITELLVSEGASVMAGAPLMRINGLDSIWINTQIPEAQLANVRPGAKVELQYPAFPGERFVGEIQALLPGLDTTTRTQTARIAAANPDRRIVPGMFARVQITAAATGAAPLLVPSEAVIATGTRHVVVVDTGERGFRAQEIRVGEDSGDETVVLAGLDEGDKVVLSGQFLIDSEASLSGTLARLAESGSSGKATGEGDSEAEASGQGPDPQEPQDTKQEPRHTAQGVIEDIDGHAWSIATDAIPSLDMGAMSMNFYHPEHLPEDEFKPGVRVSFTFFSNDDRFEIETIELSPVPAS